MSCAAVYCNTEQMAQVCGTGCIHSGVNLLLTYRINAGTVAFLGYDDRFQSGTHINDTLFLNRAFQRVNHAIFTKVSYLFRY